MEFVVKFECCCNISWKLKLMLFDLTDMSTFDKHFFVVPVV